MKTIFICTDFPRQWLPLNYFAAGGLMGRMLWFPYQFTDHTSENLVTVHVENIRL